ncbi:MAG: hypothetical protein IH892_19785 [Planctomycetes bacterium]|nr:hypothetical protein [Planctomycetota bacterium]
MLALMALLNALGGDLALNTVVEATQSSDAGQADRAIRTLCEWPDAEACPSLLQLAQDKNRSLAHHVLAVRGLVRLSGWPAVRPNKRRRNSVCRSWTVPDRLMDVAWPFQPWGTCRPGRRSAASLPWLKKAT